MARIILLDTNVLSILTGARLNPACRRWIEQGAATPGTAVYIPAISDYETRRGLEAKQAGAQIAELTALREFAAWVPVSEAAWLKAAEFWGLARRTGQSTDDPKALDGDTILAGIAATIGGDGDTVVVATANIRHLSRFGVVARKWGEIA